jgi:hypothetical protein
MNAQEILGLAKEGRQFTVTYYGFPEKATVFGISKNSGSELVVQLERGAVACVDESAVTLIELTNEQKLMKSLRDVIDGYKCLHASDYPGALEDPSVDEAEKLLTELSQEVFANG